MTHCPVCHNTVDPLRARFVGVRDGKVVAYCSAECAAKQRPAERAAPAAGAPPPGMSPATGVPARIPTPPPGVPITVDSGPVIEIVHEPASGVVTSARDARTEPTRARHPDEIPIAEHWRADQESAMVREADDADAGSAPAPAVAARRGAVAAEVHAPERAASETGDLMAAPRRGRWPLVLLALLLLGGGGYLLYRYLVQNGLAASARRSPTMVSAPARLEPKPAADRAVPAVSAMLAALDVADVVAQARAALRRDLAATSPRVRRLAAAALARSHDREACELLAAEIGVHGARDPTAGEAGGAGGAAASGAAATAAIDEARTSDVIRLGLAYALARGGDRRGSDVLAAALGAARAEVRDEAARLLALLGDRRGVPHLLDVLTVDQRRLGAAEHLAHLAEPHAIKVLDQVRGDPRASADDKARATVALGIAGRADVAGALRDMLGDPHFNAFAAAALAALADRRSKIAGVGDPDGLAGGAGGSAPRGIDRAARPVLERQLASPPLRVLAARALRRLEPAIDARPLLPPLIDVVRAGRDIDRIPAAEAILVLAGPADWSAFD